MKKQLLRLLYLLFIAVLMAGAFGALHNQISYSVSPDYFLKFKFIQFKLDWAYQYPRLGASVVGVLATWWMGVLICFPLEAVARYKFRDSQRIVSETLRAFRLILLITALSSALGLSLAYAATWNLDPEFYPILLKRDIADPLNFICAGWMHNASYFGAVLGAALSLGRLLRTRA